MGTNPSDPTGGGQDWGASGSTPPPPPPPPPTGPGYPAPPPYQQPYQQPQYAGGYGTAQEEHPRTTVGFVLSLIGLFLCGPLAIVGLVFGRQAQRDMQAAPGRYRNEGMAKAAVIVGWIAIVLWTLGTIFYIFVIAAVLSSIPTDVPVGWALVH